VRLILLFLLFINSFLNRVTAKQNFDKTRIIKKTK